MTHSEIRSAIVEIRQAIGATSIGVERQFDALLGRLYEPEPTAPAASSDPIQDLSDAVVALRERADLADACMETLGENQKALGDRYEKEFSGIIKRMIAFTEVQDAQLGWHDAEKKRIDRLEPIIERLNDHIGGNRLQNHHDRLNKLEHTVAGLDQSELGPVRDMNRRLTALESGKSDSFTHVHNLISLNRQEHEKRIANLENSLARFRNEGDNRVRLALKVLNGEEPTRITAKMDGER